MNKSLKLFLNFILMLILFAASTGLILLSAQIAQKIDTASKIEENDRIIRLYFNQRFRQNNASTSIDNQEIILIDLGSYYILIYEEEGFLIEQNSESNTIMKGAGQVIAEVNNLHIDIQDDRFLIEYENLEHQVIELVYLRYPS
jgi:hypothetical protein